MVVKLRLRSPPSGNTRPFTRMHTSTFSLVGAFPSLPYTPFPPSSSLPSTPLVTRIHSMALRHSHRNFPCGLSEQVYTQYPRPEVFLMASLLPACVCTFFLARCCLGQGAPFSQRSEQATAMACPRDFHSHF